MKITEQKKANLLRIEKARIILNSSLEKGIITESDILDIMKLDSNFALNTNRTDNKTMLLRDIYNCPFLLCDQKKLSLNFKKLLPSILQSRYLTELEELDLRYKNDYISEEEYLLEQKMLKYYYYQSSEDGKNILKNGHVSDVVDNIIKTK